jgi:NADH dehydrogenase FAD-containing subunit
VTTQAGDEVTADIWFRCYGVVPASDYLVFALGDVSAADQNKGAGAAGRQAPVVAGNIRALISGEGELAQYQPPAASIIVPIGPDGGAGQRAGSEELVPAETVAQLKGRDMMVHRFAELLGLST